MLPSCFPCDQAKPALVVATLGPLSYVLVLYAVTMAPLSHVAPAREVSTMEAEVRAMMFDPVYWIVIGAGMLLSLWAQFKVKSTFSKYSQVATRSGLTGAQIAKRILELPES